MRLNFLKIKTKSLLKKNRSSRSNLPYKKAVTVGIIFSVEDKKKHDDVKELIRKLEHDGKQVKVISYLPKQKDNYEFLFDFFTEKDLSFWGNITSSSAVQFADTPFDFLFYLDTTPNPLILNVIARSKAKCRVGKFWSEAEPYFEMMIESKGGGTKAL
ncbi:MAG: DUF6913 domain-containing protein, partial [Bacteroidota bacterium]